MTLLKRTKWHTTKEKHPHTHTHVLNKNGSYFWASRFARRDGIFFLGFEISTYKSLGWRQFPHRFFCCCYLIEWKITDPTGIREKSSPSYGWERTAITMVICLWYPNVKFWCFPYYFLAQKWLSHLCLLLKFRFWNLDFFVTTSNNPRPPTHSELDVCDNYMLIRKWIISAMGVRLKIILEHHQRDLWMFNTQPCLESPDSPLNGLECTRGGGASWDTGWMLPCFVISSENKINIEMRNVSARTHAHHHDDKILDYILCWSRKIRRKIILTLFILPFRGHLFSTVSKIGFKFL